MPILFVLFAVIPIVEIALLIQVGGVIGGLNTIALVLVTAALGAFFVKREGLATLRSAQQKMQANQVPGKELVAGACLLVAGVLLITPGFMTDVFGFLLVFPPTRNKLADRFSGAFSAHVVQGQQTSSQYTQHYYHKNQQGDVFEGEYTEHTNSKVIEPSAEPKKPENDNL